jgi:hypothetical protein
MTRCKVDVFYTENLYPRDAVKFAWELSKELNSADEEISRLVREHERGKDEGQAAASSDHRIGGSDATRQNEGKAALMPKREREPGLENYIGGGVDNVQVSDSRPGLDFGQRLQPPIGRGKERSVSRGQSNLISDRRDGVSQSEARAALAQEIPQGSGSRSASDASHDGYGEDAAHCSESRIDSGQRGQPSAVYTKRGDEGTVSISVPPSAKQSGKKKKGRFSLLKIKSRKTSDAGGAAKSPDAAVASSTKSQDKDKHGKQKDEVVEIRKKSSAPEKRESKFCIIT